MCFVVPWVACAGNGVAGTEFHPNTKGDSVMEREGSFAERSQHQEPAVSSKTGQRWEQGHIKVGNEEEWNTLKAKKQNEECGFLLC